MTKCKEEDTGYYVTNERIIAIYLTKEKAKEYVRKYKGQGLVHIRHDGKSGFGESK